MKEDFYITLLYKQLSGEISEEETQRLESWRTASPKHEQEAQEIEQVWNLTAPGDTPSVDLDQSFSKIQQRMQTPASSPEKSGPGSSAKVRRLPTWVSVAAGLALVVLGSIFVLRSIDFSAVSTEWTVASAEEEVREVSLPDKSVVTLNRGARLSYLPDMEGGERHVRLEGEAFFEVEHMPDRPFIISLAQEEIQVLGTSFNVREDESEVTVFVQTGKVAVRRKEGKGALHLSKGEGARLDRTDQSVQKDTQLNENILSWQTGKLSFKQAKLEEVCRTIGKAFGITFELSNPDLGLCMVDISFDRSRVAQFVEDLQTLFAVSIEQVASDKYLLEGGGCD